MKEKTQSQQLQKSGKKKGAFREYSESLFVALAIALVIRALVIYPFRIPTGSMEGSLLVGDFLLANKFVYGIRTPDWIGIPYTKLGFSIPFIRTPGFRDPQRGDVVIFKYPRDESLNYIKRCVALSADTVEIRNKELHINGQKFPDPPGLKYIDNRFYPPGYREHNIFPANAGNRDNYGPVRVPAPGDSLFFTDDNRHLWFEQLQIALYEGRKVTIFHAGEEIRLTVENQNRWPAAIDTYPVASFFINGKSLDKYVYVVKNVHYFMMGDNRDNSLDSRYWGFLPERNVVGEGLIIYWSWDNEVPFYRLLNKIRWSRILGLIR